MKIIGLTGGIASGKSSVSRCLSAERHVSSDVTEPGLPIVDLDLIARDALMPGTDAFRKVVHAFGSGVVKYGPASGPDTDVPYDQWRIDRKKLGEIVFNDAAARRKLNGIMQKGIALRLAGALLYHRRLPPAERPVPTSEASPPPPPTEEELPVAPTVTRTLAGLGRGDIPCSLYSVDTVR